MPNNELMTYKVVALARLTCPRANIRADGLATINTKNGVGAGAGRMYHAEPDPAAVPRSLQIYRTGLSS